MYDPKSTIPLTTPVPKAGEYSFYVVSMVLQKRKNDDLGEHWCADVKLLMKAPDGSETEHSETLRLHDKYLWLIAKFFTCLGVRKHGDNSPLTPDWWAKVAKSTGKCKITVKKGANSGKEYAQIDWLDPESEEGGIE